MKPANRTGTLVATHVWPAGYETPTPVDFLDLDWGGAIGDRHYGQTMSSDVRQTAQYERGTTIRNLRQVSIVDEDEMTRAALAMGLPAIEPGLVADNMYVRGLDGLTAYPALTRLAFSSGAVIMLGGENFPCTIAGGLIQAKHGTSPSSFPKAAMGLRGVTGWVEFPGVARPGDTIEVRFP